MGLITFIKFLCYLCLSAALLFGAFFVQDYYSNLIVEKEMEEAALALGQPELDLLSLPAEMLLTSHDHREIDVLVYARSRNYVQFELRSNRQFFKYAIAYLNVESQGLVRKYESNGLIDKETYLDMKAVWDARDASEAIAEVN